VTPVAGRRFAAMAGVSLILALAASLVPAQAKLGPVIAHYGKWSIHRGTDLMTDRVVCLATYEGSHQFQLYSDGLYVKFPEGPRAYRYRIDDDPISPTIDAKAANWHSRLITLEGAAFNRLVTAHRLRLHVVTQHFSAIHVNEIDLDLDRIYSAYGALYYCR
jgi:hypothetical protein